MTLGSDEDENENETEKGFVLLLVRMENWVVLPLAVMMNYAGNAVAAETE